MPNRDCFQFKTGTPRMSAGSDEAEVLLYGDIVPDYGKWWKENYPEDKSARDFDKAIKQVKADGAKRLLLRINSPGGIVTQAVAMRAILAAANFEQVTIRIEGLCASAATIPATLPGARVVIARGSEYMIHNPWTWAVGNANEMEKVVENLRSHEATSRGFYATRTGQSEEQIKTWMDEETWFTAEEAVKYGFADELLAEADSEPAAACVSREAMAVMRGLYRTVPEGIAVREDEATEAAKTEDTSSVSHSADTFPSRGRLDQDVSDEAPEEGGSTEINNNEEEQNSMEPNELTVEQLQAQNPALLDQVRQDAVAAERTRLADIDALTMPGYEAMAEKAKKDGTSAMDFQKQVVAAQKAKGSSFLENRAKETGRAQEVAGGAAAGGKSEEQEIADNAKDIAEYAKTYAATRGEGGMY